VHVLYLASSNPGKLQEFRDAAADLPVQIERIATNKLPVCVEDGFTFEENARKKALHYSAYVEGLVFADDSGLCVDALGGAPGVYSARFAELAAPVARPTGSAATAITPAVSLRKADPGSAIDVANNARLLRELNGIPFERRTAHYLCVIALARNRKLLRTGSGRVDGQITESPRGSGGFGYDPFFFYSPLGKTFAELTPQEKFGVSHRGKAFRQVIACLASEAGC
jgi:XTP/dITP diphosphohydrolase